MVCPITQGDHKSGSSRQVLVFVQWNTTVCQCRHKSGTPSQKWDKWATRDNCYFFRDTSLKIGTVPENPGWMVTLCCHHGEAITSLHTSCDECKLSAR